LLRGKDRKIDRFVGRGFPSLRYDTFGLPVTWFTEDQTRVPQSVQGGKPSGQRFYSKAVRSIAGTKQTRKTSRCSIIPPPDLESRADDSWSVKVTEYATFNNVKRWEAKCGCGGLSCWFSVLNTRPSTLLLTLTKNSVRQNTPDGQTDPPRHLETMFITTSSLSHTPLWVTETKNYPPPCTRIIPGNPGPRQLCDIIYILW
ncbi:hypothetical protein PpBr36_08289, partial [Pyricularia pennisetigena]|uniref:hypothetical protein n=1 Tax=Pyricularia pennisetigena TaxID=1578925 RepID=UPI001153DCD5